MTELEAVRERLEGEVAALTLPGPPGEGSPGRCLGRQRRREWVFFHDHLVCLIARGSSGREPFSLESGGAIPKQGSPTHHSTCGPVGWCVGESCFAIATHAPACALVRVGMCGLKWVGAGSGCVCWGGARVSASPPPPGGLQPAHGEQVALREQLVQQLESLRTMKEVEQRPGLCARAGPSPGTLLNPRRRAAMHPYSPTPIHPNSQHQWQS